MLQRVTQNRNFLILKNLHLLASPQKRGEIFREFVTRRLYCSAGNPSSSIWLQVLQPGGRDTSTGLYIFADTTRYLVNAGENTLRQLRDSVLPINGLEKILLTGSTLHHIGGLTNTLLATQDRLQTDHPIHVFGPHNIEAYMHTTRRSFQYLSKFDFVKLSFVSERTSWQEVLKDENFTIWGCAFNDERSKRDDGNVIYPRLAISYFFEVVQPRRLCVVTARELGVPEDMMHTVAEECLKGNPVILPCGKVIHPNDVLLSPERKQSFLVLDCPSHDVLTKLSKFIQTNMFSQDPNSYTDLIMHLTPLEVAGTQEYKAWIDSFDARTKHLLTHDTASSNPSSTFSGFVKVYHKLNINNPNIFPPLSYSSMNSETLKNFEYASNVSVAGPSLKYIFRPYGLVGFEETAVHGQLESSKLLDDCTSKLCESKENSFDKHNDFDVVFLGTGSRVSSILRNTSGILVNMSGNTSLLMDCGEGTFRQMCHHYGKHVDKILKQLRTVFVSHMHIDHHLGLVNILLQRKRIMGDSGYVRIIGPQSLDLFLRYFEMLSGESLNFRFTQFWWLKREAGRKEGRLFSRSLGLSSISVVPTKHSDYSHGIVLERNGWKIVYSADTRPCKQLIDAGKGASLLIHEATFEDKLLERAKAVNHCTVSEAIRTSEIMKAQFTILTHFSSRHLFPCKASLLPDTVSFAFDHMTIQQKDLATLHEMMSSVERTVIRSQQTRGGYPRKKSNKLRNLSR